MKRRHFLFQLYQLLALTMLPLALFAGAAIPLIFVGFAIPLAIFHLTFNTKAIFPLTFNSAELVVASLLAFALISCLWSLNPESGITTIIRGTCLLFLFYFSRKYIGDITCEQAKKLIRCLMLGMALAIIISISEILTEGVLTKFFNYSLNNFRNINMAKLNKGVVLMTITCWPIVYWLYAQKRKKLAVAMWVFLVIFTPFLESSTATMGLIIGGITFGLSLYINKKILIGIISAGLLLYNALLPISMHLAPIYEEAENIPIVSGLSARTRLLTLRYASDKALEKPLLGWGMGSADEVCTSAANDKNYTAIKGAVVLNHPHNGLMQTHVELGMMGALLLAGIYIATLRLISRMSDPLHYSAAIALLMNFWGTQQTGFGMWQNWHWCTALIAAFWLMIASRALATNDTQKAP